MGSRCRGSCLPSTCGFLGGAGGWVLCSPPGIRTSHRSCIPGNLADLCPSLSSAMSTLQSAFCSPGLCSSKIHCSSLPPTPSAARLPTCSVASSESTDPAAQSWEGPEEHGLPPRRRVDDHSGLRHTYHVPTSPSPHDCRVGPVMAPFL